MFDLQKFKPIHLLLFGLTVSIGPSIGGYCVGKAIERFKSSDKSVTVKGLAERTVDSDSIVINIDLSEQTNDINEQTHKVQADIKTLKDTLINCGFKEDDIKENTVHIIENSPPRKDELPELHKKYTYQLSLHVRADDEQRTDKFRQELSKLQSEGKLLSAQPRFSYTFTKIDEIRAPMLAEATKSARTVADQFAKDSETRVGGILRAQQGAFTVTAASSSSNSEYEYSNDTNSYQKRVRVVTNITFGLE